MRNFDQGLGGGDGNFIIFAEVSGTVEPRECTFSYPAARKNVSIVELDFL